MSLYCAGITFDITGLPRLFCYLDERQDRLQESFHLIPVQQQGRLGFNIIIMGRVQNNDIGKRS